MPEEVLVIPRTLFESQGAFQGFCTHGESALRCFLAPENNHFMLRSLAEDDPSFKQIIPYCLVMARIDDTPHYLCYARGSSGGESRLHAKRSIGIGGHINPIDARKDPYGYDTYMAGVARELDEEIAHPPILSNRIIGLINDDSSPVGKVHLGVVHCIELATAHAQAKEEAIANAHFCHLDTLSSELFDTLETWSQLCVTHLQDSSNAR